MALPSAPLTVVVNGSGSPLCEGTRSTWDSSLLPLCSVHLSPRSWIDWTAAPSLVTTVRASGVSNVTVRSGWAFASVPRGTSPAFGAAAGPVPSGDAGGALVGAGDWTAGSALCCAAGFFGPITSGKKRYSPNMQASQMATATSRFWFWFFMQLSFGCAQARDPVRPAPKGDSGGGA